MEIAFTAQSIDGMLQWWGPCFYSPDLNSSLPSHFKPVAKNGEQSETGISIETIENIKHIKPT